MLSVTARPVRRVPVTALSSLSASATVRLCYQPDALTIEVTDDGPGPAPDINGPPGAQLLQHAFGEFGAVARLAWHEVIPWPFQEIVAIQNNPSAGAGQSGSGLVLHRLGWRLVS